MKQLPTLLPWLKLHIFMLATLLSAGVALYGFYTREVNDFWWQCVGGGIVGLITFGIMSLIFERKSKATMMVGIAGVTAGVLMTLAFTMFILFLIIVVMVLLKAV